MRPVITVAIIALALTGPAIAQTPAPAGGDEAAIRRILQDHDEARNRSDWKAMGQLFVDDAEQLTSTGEWRKGRAEIEKGVAQRMATVYKGGKYLTKIETVRMLTPSVALVDGTFEIANIAGGASRRGHTTYILVKSDDRWRIAAARSMVPTPVGATR
jgi:uncharacterized protein (TIGR02246 family)